jgi:hypothetical protein
VNSLRSVFSNYAGYAQYRNLELGCKRIVFDAGYLKAMHKPNMSMNFDGIQSIVEDGIITKTGMFRRCPAVLPYSLPSLLRREDTLGYDRASNGL